MLRGVPLTPRGGVLLVMGGTFTSGGTLTRYIRESREGVGYSYPGGTLTSEGYPYPGRYSYQ